MSKKKYFLITLIALIVVVVFLYLFRLVGNSTLITGEYETSTVDRGMVYTTEESTGIVEPANEVIILCPGSSVIKKISKKPGSYVFTGETILTLDPEPVESQIEKLSDQLNIMQNDLDKNRLNARGIKVDLDYDLQVKKLRIVSLKSDLENEEDLLKVGGISPSKVDKTKQELTLAEQDLKTTTEKNSIRLKQLEIEEAGILLKIDIQKKELERNHELLKKMIVRAPSSGIILTMQGSEGEKVNTDVLLVRMSDLSVLKIRASIGIKKVGIIKTGGIVYAIVENEKVLGTIGDIKPLANDEKIDFDVFLNENKHSRLIPNQKVEIRIVTQQAPNVLRLKRGDLINKNKKQYVYVLGKDKAVRRRIETGLSDMEYIQVLSGLQEGERVIISASAAFRHMKEINIK
jgi:HlyD family secretion protein